MIREKADVQLGFCERGRIVNSILSVTGLSKNFIIRNSTFTGAAVIEAVKNVSFDIYPGDSFGLIGESGCGKTTLANMILRLLEPTKGNVYLEAREITRLGEHKMRPLRKDIQIVFQQSAGVLDPKMTVGELISEPLRIHKVVNADENDKETDRLLDMVGLTPNEKTKFPYQMSGGQVQRIIIARAIAVRPKIIILDEPVASLDVSVQGQILNLLQKLKKEMGLTYLFITHDLKVVKHICSRIAVMYKGVIVESGPVWQVFNSPKNDYTKMLIESIL